MILRVTTFLALLILTVEAKKYAQDQQQWQEFEEFRKWKQSKEQARENGPKEINQREQDETHDISEIYEKRAQNPPPIDQAALMGRYIVNQADWTAVATISVRKDVESFPVANLVSFSDGPLGNGTGVPYLFLTPLDFTAQDLAKDHRATLLMTLAQGDYCKSKSWDPMDPRCARILLSGKIKAVKNESMEHEIAKKSIFERHPKLVHMPADHHFFIAKLKITSIAVLDTFGGPKYVSVKDYLHPSTANVTEDFLRLFPAKDGPAGEQQFRPISTLLNPMVRNV